MGQRGLLRRWLKEGCKDQHIAESDRKSEQPTGKTSSAALGVDELNGLLQTLAATKQPEVKSSGSDTAGPAADTESKLHVPLKDRKSRRLNRAHEFIPGKSGGHELNLREFLYGNLLMFENMVVSQSSDTLNYVRHLSFLMLKETQGYITSSLIDYDYALCDQLEYSAQAAWPAESSADLMNRYLCLSSTQPTVKSSQSPSQTNTLGGRCVRWNNSEDGAACKDKKRCKWAHAYLVCNNPDHTVRKCPKATANDQDKKGKSGAAKSST